MVSFNWNGPTANFDTMFMSMASRYNNELFLRYWIRFASDWSWGTTSSAGHFMRFYQSSPYNDWLDSNGAPGSWISEVIVNGNTYGSQWNGLPNSSWHKYEKYINRSTGVVKMWLDDSLFASWTGVSFGSQKYDLFYIMSNWGTDKPDSTNHMYLDDWEVWSDTGSSSFTGSMSNGDIALSGGGGDTTPPVISGLLPTGVQSNLTTSVTLQATTDENATCKYNTTDTSYASMSNTFATTGGTAHSQSGFAVSAGNSYTRYVRCSDTSGNANTSSSTISFSVANPTVTSVVCTQFSPTQSPGSIPCQSATNGTPTSYAWSFQSAMPYCSFSPQSANTTLTCQYGANPKPCLTIQPGGSSLCTTATYPFRYNKPSGFGVN